MTQKKPKIEKRKIVIAIIIPIVIGVPGYYVKNHLENKQKISIAKSQVLEAEGYIKRGLYKEAILKYQDILKYIPENRDADLYGRIRGNEGVANIELSNQNKKEEYAMQALNSLQEALKTYAGAPSSIEYSLSYLSIANAYIELATYKEPRENINNAIGSLKNAVELSKKYKQSDIYAKSQNGLGNTYFVMSNIESGMLNIKNSINAFNEANKYFKANSYEYAMIHSNLCAAYTSLYGYDNLEDTINKSIENGIIASKYFTIESNRIEYGNVQNNLGVAYKELSKINHKEDNLNKSLRCFDKALLVRTYDKDPFRYAKTIYNIGNVYSEMASIKDRSKNYTMAIKYYNESLGIYTPYEYQYEYTNVKYNLGKTYYDLYDSTKNVEHLRIGLRVLEEAMDMSKNNPILNRKINNNINQIKEKMHKI